MIAAIPVVEPSAEMLKVVSAWLALEGLRQLRDQFGPEGVGAFDHDAAREGRGDHGESEGDAEKVFEFHKVC